MTAAPSQTPEAAGLEVALSAILARAICESEGKEWTALDNTREDVERWFRLGEVTAASAQAAIDAEKAKVAELEADVTAAHAAGRFLIAAEKARADRLAKALRKSREGWTNALELGLLPPQHEETAADLRDEADEALQQETQP